jgi:hypothetical protein
LDASITFIHGKSADSPTRVSIRNWLAIYYLIYPGLDLFLMLSLYSLDYWRMDRFTFALLGYIDFASRGKKI